MMSIKRAVYLVFLLKTTLGYSQTVTNVNELNAAVSEATPGTEIVLADGTWNNVFVNIDKHGNASSPITITAQNPGAVILTGNSRVYMEGSYLTVSGLVFQNPANLVANSSTIEPVIELNDCNNCKVLNNKIDHYNGTESQKTLKFKWLLIDGERIEIAYNSFIGKYGIGSIINDNRNDSAPDYLEIHHNYFADRTPINGVNDDNDQDAIRIGNSSSSLDDSFSKVYDNYFFNFFGEIEVISNKSGQNQYYNNTFRNYSGTLTLRHGNNCEVYGNYFFAEDNIYSGGVRVIGEGHKVYNNYIEGVNSNKINGSISKATGGINVTNGRLNSALNGYFQVKNTQIVNNTFVNCDYGLRIGTKVSSDLDQEPQNLTVANNISYNSSENGYETVTSPSGISPSQGNLIEIPLADMTDDGAFHRLVAGSSPIDMSVGEYSFVDKDVLNGNRDDNSDAGAEEFGAQGENLPFNEQDVGVSVGFGVLSNPTLILSPSIMEFGKYEGEMTFEVISNVDWEITENVDWLSFDMTSSYGRRVVKVFVDENTTGADRSVIIDVVESGVAGGLVAELTVTQLSTFLPIEIPIIGATSVGMQVKDGISEDNAFDDDLSTYWTGDPATEDEVSITFDLSCLHVLSDIGIHFWKADERQTEFSIAVSNDLNEPFVTILESEVSNSDVGVETEQLFSLNQTIARYVKFIGLGNSSETDWTSIANVNVYGDLNCEGTSSTSFIDEMSKELSLYPIPVLGDIMTISSKRIPLGKMSIINASGKLIFQLNANNVLEKQIDISTLPSGLYYIQLSDRQSVKFIKP